MRCSRKLLYLPGMICLLGLYPVLIHQLERWKVFENYHTMMITWYSTDPHLRDLYDQQSIPMIKYQMVNLTGDEESDNIKIKCARGFIREMALLADTTKLVRIHFEDTSKYDSFVQILEVCRKEKMLKYALYQNDCWIFYRRHQKTLINRVPPK